MQEYTVYDLNENTKLQNNGQLKVVGKYSFKIKCKWENRVWKAED
jgi:hypothetical protein